MSIDRSVKKVIAALVSALLCGIMLSGCGEEFPTLTQEEYDLIVDYSAGVLAKYSTNCGDKLTRVTPSEEPEEVQPQAPAPAEEEMPAPPEKEEKPEKTDAEPVNNQDTDGESGAPSDEETISETGDEEPGDEPSADTPDEGIVETGGDDIFQRLQDGIRVDYNGYYVLNKYPDNVSGSGTALKAEPGNKLLILSFDLTNEKSEAVYADLLAADPMFTVMIDSKPVSKNLVTLLDNEMSTFAGNMEPGETKGVVLCFNITEAQAGQLEQVILRVNCRGEEQIVRLQ